MSILVLIGSGMMGSALCFPAADNGHELRLVGTMLDRDIINELRKSNFHPTLKRTLPDNIKYYQLEELGTALEGAEYIIGGVSSFGVDWFADEILPNLPKGLPVLSVTKGMINAPGHALTTYPALYLSRVPGHDYCAIGGPCTSYELADRVQTHVCFCGDNMSSLKKFRELFHTSYYHISLSTDVAGVELAVALKNAYALAVTLAVGLSQVDGNVLHYNSQAALFGQSVSEMRKLLALFGGHENNIVYGAGDLYVTIFGGRTRLLGTLLGQGISFKNAIKQLSGVTLESVVIATRTVQAVNEKIRLGAVSAEDFPLLLHVGDIITSDSEVCIPWDLFQTESITTL